MSVTDLRPKLAFIIDHRLSRERITKLAQNLSVLRHKYRVHLIQDQESGKTPFVRKLLEKHAEEKFQLILAPVHLYTQWTTIEATLGLSRTNGPAFAGYIFHPIPYYTEITPPHPNRKILLDFQHLNAQEIYLLVRALIEERNRFGLSALLDVDTTIYCETWLGGQGVGNKMDNILILPEVKDSHWSKRMGAIRIILSALWGLVYEEGPGRFTPLAQIESTISNKAYFQIGITDRCMAMRVYFDPAPTLSPSDAVYLFSPKQEYRTRASQLLLRFADFVRIHTIPEVAELEVTVGFFASAPAEKAPDQARTLWIEPLTARLITEPAYETPSPSRPNLKEFPSMATHQPEALLTLFQKKYFEAQFQIRQFQTQMEQMKRFGASIDEILILENKIKELSQREAGWIKILAETMKNYKSRSTKAT